MLAFAVVLAFFALLYLVAEMVRTVWRWWPQRRAWYPPVPPSDEVREYEASVPYDREYDESDW